MTAADPLVALRRATVADLDAIMEIESGTFASDAWSRGTMRAELGSRHGFYLVADWTPGGGGPPHPDAAIAGYAGLLAPLGSGQADIQTIAVASSARRRGIGRAMMVALLEEARRREASEVFLEVRADNPNAEALYASLGFEQIAVRPKYYQPDGVDAHIMKAVIT
ncbi:MAG: ribosomal protein S18-alanine N-acetyltransferase [Acidobacteria bacterium]|nr:ribosomal protein S18-alanine N-acetyltransferase [Acidobacteriota bacterium]